MEIHRKEKVDLFAPTHNCVLFASSTSDYTRCVSNICVWWRGIRLLAYKKVFFSPARAGKLRGPSYTVGTWEFPSVVTTQLHAVPRLRRPGTLTPPPHISSWCGTLTNVHINILFYLVGQSSFLLIFNIIIVGRLWYLYFKVFENLATFTCLVMTEINWNNI
jgi:hypothetical protein